MSKEKILSEVFESYLYNQKQILKASRYIQTVLTSVLSEEGNADLENEDDFLDIPADRQISTVRSKEPDAEGEMHQLHIELFAEGRASVTASRYKYMECSILHSEEREFFSQQPITHLKSLVVFSQLSLISTKTM